MEDIIEVTADTEEFHIIPALMQQVFAAHNNYPAAIGFGFDLAPDYPKAAATYFHFAAQHGQSNASFFLGLMYLEGRGVKQDDRKALKWLTQTENFQMALHILMHYTLPPSEEKDKRMKLLRYARFILTHGISITELYKRHPSERLSSNLEKILTAERDTLELFYRKGVVPRARNDVLVYRRDAELFDCAGARRYLTEFASVKYFEARYHLAMLADEAHIFDLCNKAPNEFLETLITDPFIIRSQYDRYMEYLFNTHLLILELNNQMEIAAYLFYRGALTDEIAGKIMVILRHIPHDNERYEEAQWILWHLSALVGRKDLAQYHFAHTPFATNLSVLDDATFARCEAELATEWEYNTAEMNLSETDFKQWLETQFKALEPRELNLSPMEAMLFYEYCFRLAQIYIKENSKVIDYYLDRIPCDHKRFMEAQSMLQHCPAHKQTGRHLTTFYADIRNDNNNSVSNIETRERETYGARSRKL